MKTRQMYCVAHLFRLPASLCQVSNYTAWWRSRWGARILPKSFAQWSIQEWNSLKCEFRLPVKSVLLRGHCVRVFI